jgi:plastocyanin
MFRRSGLGILCMLTCVGALALPAAAGARTKTVTAGPPNSIRKVAAKFLPKSFVKTYSPDVNAFFGRRTTIHVGDTVSFLLHGFHTVDLPGKSNEDLPLIVSTGKLANGFNDAAGVPFWFNGKLPLLGFNPVLFGRSKAHKYNGTKRLDSGAISSKPFKVSFTKPGRYKFFCDVHPGMVGFITVKPKAATIPSAKQDAASLLAQETAIVKSAKKLIKTKQPTNTVSVGESASNGLELFTMFPATLTVHPGTVVTFRMSPHSRETHTATFGPVSYLKPIAKSFQGGPFISPLGTYPSDPTQPLTLTPVTHGNGFVSTGVMDNDSSTKQVGPSSKIDFTTPGTYHYVCLIHPFMQGTIIVK